ncbi:hypothetical protein QWI29_17955 [Mycolicibacterium neoaurum]|uniref:hypothetical protein n=1 Tax=Mycolicibacterium neoaurum TaxID=1795 RepID=UPI0026731E08|nr:hypothetical protein [Mycolicibacterium neoaurum]MDO3401929.1 hypothetical protein [Mycolicibacterium neoaurum]
MKQSYPPEQVAAEHLPSDWKDAVRWLKRRLASGEIPGKRISRGVWRMTDEDVEAWLSTRDKPAAPVAEVSVLDGLSSRSRAKRSA